MIALLLASCAFVPVDYAGTLSLEVPLTAYTEDCSIDVIEGDFAITQSYDTTSLQCLMRATWHGELVDLGAIRGAVVAKAAEYGRAAAQIDRVEIQQLDFAFETARIDGFPDDALPSEVNAEIKAFPDDPNELLASVTAHTTDLDLLGDGLFASTEAGPVRNRNAYERGNNSFLDALTDAYADERPFDGVVISELRANPAQTSALAALDGATLTLEARVAVGATFWTSIP